MSQITEKTLMPLGLVLMLAGGIFWLSTIYIETKANGQEIREIKQGQTRYVEDVENINVRLARIEGALGIRESRETK